MVCCSMQLVWANSASEGEGRISNIFCVTECFKHATACTVLDSFCALNRVSQSGSLQKQDASYRQPGIPTHIHAILIPTNPLLECLSVCLFAYLIACLFACMFACLAPEPDAIPVVVPGHRWSHGVRPRGGRRRGRGGGGATCREVDHEAWVRHG